MTTSSLIVQVRWYSQVEAFAQLTWVLQAKSSSTPISRFCHASSNTSHLLLFNSERQPSTSSNPNSFRPTKPNFSPVSCPQ